jgi:D-sedoheptulose 7-phosphate isomerase
VIGITGYDGGKLDKLSDIHLRADGADMQIAEDLHLFFDHLMMSVILRNGEDEK